MDEGPDTSMDFYRAASTVIPTLLVTVAIQGRFFELSRKVTFRHQYRTVLFAIVVFGGEAGTLMTVARQETTGPLMCTSTLALLALGLTTIYLALTGTDVEEEEEEEEARDRDESGGTPRAV
jgi:hypothetical protein